MRRETIEVKGQRGRTMTVTATMTTQATEYEINLYAFGVEVDYQSPAIIFPAKSFNEWGFYVSQFLGGPRLFRNPARIVLDEAGNQAILDTVAALKAEAEAMIEVVKIEIEQAERLFIAHETDFGGMITRGVAVYRRAIPGENQPFIFEDNIGISDDVPAEFFPVWDEIMATGEKPAPIFPYLSKVGRVIPAEKLKEVEYYLTGADSHI